MEFATDLNSRAEFFWSHGLISDAAYKLFTTSCNYSRYVSEYYRGSLSPTCSRVMSLVTRETSRFVDNYDVTLDVCISSVLSQSKILRPQVKIVSFFCFLLSELSTIFGTSCFKVFFLKTAASHRKCRCMYRR